MSRETRGGATLLARARKGVNAQIEALALEVDGARRKDRLEGLLRRMACLWGYSFHNQYLIESQRPGVTQVKGRSQWARAGRTVREGEVPIAIYSPGSARGWPFLQAFVFDILQTDGPTGAPAIVAEARAWLPRVEAAAELLGVTLHDLEQGIDGFSGVLGGAGRGRVGVHPGLAPHDRIAVLAHEYAHILLHPRSSDGRPPRPIRELEAEGSAHVVCTALELHPVPDSARGLQSPAEYIAWMGGDSKGLLLSMRRIAAASKAILTAIEGKRPRVRVPLWTGPPKPRMASARNRRKNAAGRKRRRIPHPPRPRSGRSGRV